MVILLLLLTNVKSSNWYDIVFICMHKVVSEGGSMGSGHPSPRCLQHFTKYVINGHNKSLFCHIILTKH